MRFAVDAYAPVPFMHCYCSICRKTAGGGGYAINIMGARDTLQVQGEAHIGVYRATIDGEESTGERRFCTRCASALWVWDPNWPDLVHPFASAIDTPLPEPPERVHIMLDHAAAWCQPDIRDGDRSHGAYPDESIEDWHRRHGLMEGE